MSTCSTFRIPNATIHRSWLTVAESVVLSSKSGLVVFHYPASLVSPISSGLSKIVDAHGLTFPFPVFDEKKGIFPALLSFLRLPCIIYRTWLYSAQDTLKKDPGRVRQNSLDTAGTDFTKPGAQNKVDRCMVPSILNSLSWPSADNSFRGINPSTKHYFGFS